MSKKRITQILLILSLLVPSSSCELSTPKKIGILFGSAGMSASYSPWTINFFAFLFDVFPPGFLAGGPQEGSTCYTLIHYANEAEATVCGVEQGTPIDIFCTPYTGSYQIHSILDHLEDETFSADCYEKIFLAHLISQSDATTDPFTGEEILGPHVDDPDGSGIGIADFLEMTSFEMMDTYSRIPDQSFPFREQVLKWWYGNDAPGYPPGDPEPANIKDRLEELLPEHNFVFRHGWDAYAENIDMYGNPRQWPDSFETAIDELINEEEVDTIIVACPNVFNFNLKQYGHEWYNNNGQGVSAIADKTYKECVEDTSDGIGPATEEEVHTFLTNKPWEKHWKHPFPLIKHLAETHNPEIDIRFASGYSKFEEYEWAMLETLHYTVNKYSIPENSSLKVILLEHGLYDAYMGAVACDCYYQKKDELANRLIERIKNNFPRSGPFDVVSSPMRYGEGPEYDPPSQNEPFGQIMSVGEVIESSINGTYVNALGEIVDNGINNFETIIVLNSFFHFEDQDVLYATRSVLGNHIFSTITGSYQRDQADADGTDYQAEDIDEDYFSVKSFDGTGWPGTPGCIQDPGNCGDNNPIYKGSVEKPTKIIICGTFLGNVQQIGRNNFTEAQVKTIIEAIEESGK